MIYVVVGMQWGDEGKGKTVAAISRLSAAHYVVRCGGPNAGHTFRKADKAIETHHISPALLADPNVVQIIPPGGVVSIETLRDELVQAGALFGADLTGRLIVDRNAVVILPEHVAREQGARLRDRVASYANGTGMATASRISRGVAGTVRLAADYAGDLRGLGCEVADTLPLIHEARAAGASVVLEGTQGVLLSIYHGPYPYVTSRDTSPAGVMSEAGIAPGPDVMVVGCLRTLPIRVPGNSGPMPNETTWEALGLPVELERIGSWSAPKRVARFDHAMWRRAVMLARPGVLSIHGFDLICDVDPRSDRRAFCEAVRQFVRGLDLHSLIGRGPFSVLVSFGRDNDDLAVWWERPVTEDGMIFMGE